MAGANVARLCAVFGESTKSRIKTCEFHFKDHRNKKANRLDSQSGKEFKSLCNELLESVSEKHYDTVKKRLGLFNAAKEEWGHRDKPNMSFLEVCQADVRDSLLLDTELRAYAAGTATGGDGPSFLQSKKREYARELNKARKMGEELLQTDAKGLTIDPAVSFRPTERKKRTQEATRKEKVNRQKQTAATGTFDVTDKRDGPSHTTPSSSSFVPAPDPLSSNYFPKISEEVPKVFRSKIISNIIDVNDITTKCSIAIFRNHIIFYLIIILFSY